MDGVGEVVDEVLDEVEDELELIISRVVVVVVVVVEEVVVNAMLLAAVRVTVVLSDHEYLPFGRWWWWCVYVCVGGLINIRETVWHPATTMYG